GPVVPTGGGSVVRSAVPGPCYTPPVLDRAVRVPRSRRSAIALPGRIGRPVRRPSDQTMAIRRKAGGATRPESIPDPDHAVGAFCWAAPWTAGPRFEDG